MTDIATIYLQTFPPRPPGIMLRAGPLSCLYEDGFLRYIKYDDREIVRMIYCAVRDQTWETVPSTISDESIESRAHSFRITYTRTFVNHKIRYKSRICIDGFSAGRIRFTFDGMAQTPFLRNRIGICVHLPLDACVGKRCWVEDRMGRLSSGVFPIDISPHQPFREIRKLRWQPLRGLSASLLFSGEEFEMEDHRNWTDASFKIYGTPLGRAFPVDVETEERVLQDVELITSGIVEPAPKRDLNRVAWSVSPTRHIFPSLGTTMPAEFIPDSSPAWELLQALPLTYYRVTLYLSRDWRATWKEALRHQARLMLSLAVVLYFDDPAGDTHELLTVLYANLGLLHSVIVLSQRAAVTPAALAERQLPSLRKSLPGIPVGTGTDRHFAEWNRAVPGLVPGDYTVFSITPQVHANDTRTLVENLAAQRDTVLTASRRLPNVPVQISPLTLLRSLEAGTSCKAIDTRQSSLFGAAWTAVSLNYLRGAVAITYYEAFGLQGLIPGANFGFSIPGQKTPTAKVYPVYLVLGLVGAFAPDLILDSRSDRPLEVDGLALGRKDGGRLLILSNFSPEPQAVAVDGDVPFIKQLVPDHIASKLADPEPFIFGGFDMRESGELFLPPYSLTFLSNQPRHGR